MRTLRLALVQMNPTVGDLVGNQRAILDSIERARSAGADLVAFPELALTGYPPEDLLLKPQFVRDNQAALVEIAYECQDITAVVGYVHADGDLYNSAAVLHQGRSAAIYNKCFLPNYGVFDEDRYFSAGQRGLTFSLAGVQVGVTICEDIWYPGGPAAAEAAAGAEIIVNINGSPYHDGKRLVRQEMLATRASDYSVILAYVNMVGGQDELVFDGASLVYDQDGDLLAQAPAFEEHMLVVDLDTEAVFRRRLHDPRRRKAKYESLALLAVDRLTLERPPRTGARPAVPACHQEPPDRLADVYAALVLGTGDYVGKNGFSHVVIGMSGGIDSSLVATVAGDALGAEHVTGVAMPSRFSSEGSLRDARAVAENLGCQFMELPIERGHQAMLETLAETFTGTGSGLAEENLQARLRGNLLMALSNKFGWLVLTTGNKSEMATGYSTLYGDMAGGFAVLKDVPKTLVYELARHRNARGPKPVIPQSVLEKAPSAELRPNQKDEDSLPPYEVLDPILRAYVEQDRSYQELLDLGFDAATVLRVIRLVDSSEYKRRQAPPGVKITPRAFGRDRRLPITNRYRSY